MKVLFFTPPSPDTYVRLGRCGGKSKGGEKWPPVKLMFAAGAIRDKASVRLIDAEARIPRDRFLEEVQRFAPDLLVFEPTPASIDQENHWCDRIKDLIPDARSVALGGFASPFAARILERFGAIDFVVEGEAETPLAQFVREGQAGPGFWRREAAQPVFAGNCPRVTDLDRLPFPAHDLIERKAYHSPLVRRMPFTITESARGCPHGCRFCNAHFMGGKTPRFRSIDNLMEEMRFISRCGFREVKFNDETFTLNRARTLAFAEAMRREQLDLTWKCNSRVDCLDDELLEEMAAAGCHTIFLGVESAIPALQAYYGKSISLERVEQLVRAARRHKIRTVLHFIVGAPDESWETIRQSIRFACRANPDFIGVNLLTPYPGTEVFDDLAERGMITTGDVTRLDQSFAAAIRTHHLSPEELQQAVKLANRSFYYRPAYLLRRLVEIRNPGEFRRSISGFFALLRHQ